MKKNFVHLLNGKSANVGNFALKSGAEYLLSKYLNFNIDWTYEHWDDYSFLQKKFDNDFVKLINSKDALLVSGAVAFNGRSYYSNTGNRFDMPIPLLKKIKKPIIFFGLSYRVWSNKNYKHLDKLNEFLEFIKYSPNIILALRNDGTYEWMSNLLNSNLEFVKVIPDPGIFVQSKIENNNRFVKTNKLNIIISLNDEDRKFRFKPFAKRENLIKSFASIIDTIVKKYDANIILVPHYFDDYKAIGELIEFVKPYIGHRNITATGLGGIDDGHFFYGLYKKVDLSISMRVHSLSPCIGMGVPLIAVSTQNRISNFMKRIGLETQCEDAFDKDFVINMLNKIDFVINNSENIKIKQKKVKDNQLLISKNFIKNNIQNFFETDTF